MGNDKKTTVVLDLDNKEFVKKLKESLGLMGELGNTEGVEDLANTFLKIGTIAGVAGAAILAVKVALDLTKEAEHVHQVENSFEALSKSAGLAGEEIKSKLVGAAKGLADDTDILQAANKAIIEMGSNAKVIPQTMELARKATVLFGGDLISNFEAMNRALASGNERALRQFGIMVDSDKAVKDYAKSLGVGVEFLTDAAKKQAIMNAALEQAQKKYKDVDESTLATTNNIKSLSVTFSELKESIALAFEKLAGPTVTKLTEAVSYAAGYWAKAIKNVLGVETQKQHEEHQDNIKKEIDLQNQAAESAKEAGKPQIDYEKLKTARLKFEKELEDIRLKRSEADLQFATTEEEAIRAFNEKKLAMEKEANLQKEQLKKEGLDKGIITQQQYAEAVANIDKTLHDKQVFNDQDLQAARIKALDNYQKKATTVAGGIQAAFAKGSTQAKMDLNNWGKTGGIVFDSVKNRSVEAFKAMGNGSKDAAAAMKGFMFGSIADTAEAKGTEMLLSGLWPPNPIAIAGGGALIALSEALRSQAQGSSSSGVGGGGGGGGASAQGDQTQADTAAVKPEAQQQQKKVVSVNIQGSYYETEQTRTRLMDMIRESGDFTDFNLKQIGQQ